ncbi:MAG: choice-of-anchor I family protein [Flavobacteriales bacterium]|nr:choice-of-anchor I family protein [Flavobacteriales bacterium]
MKKSLLGLLLIVCSLSLQSQVRITEVMSSGGTSDWFELTNYGSTAIDITGWKVDDNSFNFATSVLLNGVTSIAPNERVMFCENANAAYASTFRTFWGLAADVQVGTYIGSGIGLSSSGDGVIVFDASGIEVWRVSFGAATAGSSFYWGYDIAGNFDPMYVGAANVGLVSVLGTIQSQVTVNSADVAMNVGSPRTSIQPVNPVLGCMDAIACNYNSAATTSDNSCTYGQTYYLDQDADGYGTAGTSTVSCTAVAGYVLSNTDCNDEVAAISPGASENCLNLLDDNCDGLVNVGCPNAEVSIASASNFIQVNENAGTVSIPVSVTNANALPINVHFELSVYSNAIVGSDFTWVDSLVIEPLTNGVVNHSVSIIDDSVIENAERVIVRILSSSNGVVHASNNYRIIFIKDNEVNNIPSTNELNLNLLSSFSNGTSGVNSAEIVAHCRLTQRLFIANSIAAKMDIVDFANPASPVLISSIDMTPYGNINSIAVHDGIIAVAIENSNAQENGKIVFFDPDGVFVNEVPTGAMPDMITFSKDYSKVITANEGEPSSDYSVDPEGSITVVDISGGIANLTNANATQISLTQFNGQEIALRAQGIRIFTTSASVAQDLEPEYVAVSDDNTKAYITLQENNAILVVDLLTNTIESIRALGFADYSEGSGNSLDASDQSGAILNTSGIPIRGVYMPDAISYSTINGNGYVFMANEGDSREFGSVIDANRISSSTFNNLDPVAFPQASILRNNKFLGRLSALKYSGDTDGDGDYDELHVMGSRSFTIRNAATNELVFDSKDLFEKITANSALTAAFFNASNTTGAAVSKNRSDDKGPEPEGVTVAEIDGVHYAFIALERVGGCMVFNVENPNAPVFVTYANNRTLNGSGPDLGAEGIIFISAEDSPNGQAIVILANEVSSTLSIFAANTCASLSASVVAPAITSACQGEAIQLTASIEANVTSQWYKDGQAIGMMNQNSLSVTETGSYHLEVTNSQFQCSHSYNNIEVAIYALPELTVPADLAVCFGSEIQLQAQGADSILWEGNLANGSILTPANSGTYTAVGVNEYGCESSVEWNVQVNEVPTVYAGEDITVCEGSYVEFAGAGAIDYVWSNGVSDTYGTLLFASEEITVTGTNAFGCSDTDTLQATVLPNQNFYEDMDMDGYGNASTLISTCVQPLGYITSAGDCNDMNAAVNDGMMEVCNDVDDNCNNLVDDGLDFANYYFDNDGDMFGNTMDAVFSCQQPNGYVLSGGDCNDNAFGVYPGSAELCNGTDDDCDGSIDNGLVFLSYYGDADGDTYGDINNSESFCSDPGSPFVTNDADCDDTNAQVNPGATEIWENGIDDDCNPSTSDVSVEELSAMDFNVFPNPVQNVLTIVSQGNDLDAIHIYNAVGTLISTFNPMGSVATLDISDWSAGYYVVRIGQTSKTIVKL